jgi:hyaluronoglucosaminidase
VRGVVEGFYGPPWNSSARRGLIEFIAERGMNAYVYAPKDDPLHRERWREPYGDSAAQDFRALARAAQSNGVRFGFAISPGLDIDYTSSRDRAALASKLVPLGDAGVEWFVLALDDIPMRPSLDADQAGLCTWLLGVLEAHIGEVQLTLVPTEYVGTYPTPYLSGLARELPEHVELMWTGPTVCSPSITADQARARAAALGGRRPVLWDNFPVNDGPMARSVHLGPYRGRDPELAEELGGVLCNPMPQAHASRLALSTAAEWLTDPDAYDANAAWARAIAAVGGPHADSLGVIATACADGPLMPPEELQAHRLLDGLEAARSRPGRDDARSRLQEHLTAVHHASLSWDSAGNDPLARELAPWLRQARHEADAGLAALRLLQVVSDKKIDAQSAMLHAFGVLFAWSAARAGDHVVFGPRFAAYPAVVQLSDGRPGLDVRLALREDRSAIDRLCRLAIAEYGRSIAGGRPKR